MRCALTVKPSGKWDRRAALDRVVLDAEDRHCRRVSLTTEGGISFLLNLPRATFLRDGDGLLLDDGAIIAVAGKPEPLVEISAPSARDLARLAWHIGNRHTDLQVIGETLRIRRDPVLEDMLAALGARLEAVDAVFEPEQGAYAHHHDD